MKIVALIGKMQLAWDRGEPLTLEPEQLVSLLDYMSCLGDATLTEIERQEQVDGRTETRAALSA
jgi:hypothetical protein